ncbi:MAG: ABC transporter ATP-binding protein [Caldiserica bacterium]|jgi:ABC-2 type transport system ATP-binding protein|nr:ABC transporter ATP-binding protein [Caldisericota bacterium]MDH7562123.1 ABC transporter ATP-binding protein [Caldisericota bacterium]
MSLAVETISLTKRYGRKVALDGLNLQVEEGSIFGLLGPNGAGKTTTIKLITGLRKPTTGKIILFGEDISRLPNQAGRDLGYLSERPSFYGWMTAREYLSFVGSFGRMPGRELRMRVDYLLNLVSLHRVREPIRSFSRGMRQRLGIAQALINNPKLLVLDEPASALDPLGRKELLETIKALRGGVTILLSTHILSDAETVCDYVCILHQGKMLAQESVSSLRTRYSGRKIELETTPENEEFLLKLRRAEWVEDLKKDGGILTLKVRDVSRAEIEIPSLLSEFSLPLKKMEEKEPTLEEIFLEVLKEEDAGA